jgi:hypothetical protein
MAADKLPLANLMTIELQAGKISHHRLKQRLALDKRQGCRIAAIKMQEVESVKDQAHAARPVGRGLGIGEVRKAVIADAAQFAVEIGGLRTHGRERRKRAGIFGAPVEAGARQEVYLAAFNGRRHAETVKLDFMEPLRPRRGRLNKQAGAVSTAEEATWVPCLRGSDRCAVKSIRISDPSLDGRDQSTQRQPTFGCINGGFRPSALAAPGFRSIPAPFLIFAVGGKVSRSSQMTVLLLNDSSIFLPRAIDLVFHLANQTSRGSAHIGAAAVVQRSEARHI